MFITKTSGRQQRRKPLQHGSCPQVWIVVRYRDISPSARNDAVRFLCRTWWRSFPLGIDLHSYAHASLKLLFIRREPFPSEQKLGYPSIQVLAVHAAIVGERTLRVFRRLEYFSKRISSARVFRLAMRVHVKVYVFKIYQDVHIGGSFPRTCACPAGLASISCRRGLCRCRQVPHRASSYPCTRGELGVPLPAITLVFSSTFRRPRLRRISSAVALQAAVMFFS